MRPPLISGGNPRGTRRNVRSGSRGRRIAVALEQGRGALIFMLGKYAHLVLYPVHPNTLDHYRKSVYPSGAKSDPADAALILDLLCTHTERLRPFHPETVETRTLSFWSRHGERLWTTKRAISTGAPARSHQLRRRSPGFVVSDPPDRFLAVGITDAAIFKLAFAADQSPDADETIPRRRL
jgi:Transposase